MIPTFKTAPLTERTQYTAPAWPVQAALATEKERCFAELWNGSLSTDQECLDAWHVDNFHQAPLRLLDDQAHILLEVHEDGPTHRIGDTWYTSWQAISDSVSTNQSIHPDWPGQIRRDGDWLLSQVTGRTTLLTGLKDFGALDLQAELAVLLFAQCALLWEIPAVQATKSLRRFQVRRSRTAFTDPHTQMEFWDFSSITRHQEMESILQLWDKNAIVVLGGDPVLVPDSLSSALLRMDYAPIFMELFHPMRWNPALALDPIRTATFQQAVDECYAQAEGPVSILFFTGISLPKTTALAMARRFRDEVIPCP
jgi:hypothetical protein